MELSSFSLIKWVFNDDPHFALLAIFCMAVMFAMYRKVSNKLDKVWERLTKVELAHADEARRIDIHSEHFDVVRADTDQAKEQSHKALSLCFNMVKSLKELSLEKKKSE